MRTRVALLAALCATLFAASPSLAAPVIGGWVFGSLNTYAMGDVNDIVDFVNSNAGSNFDNISTRFGAGLGARLWFTPNWMADAVWEPLFAKTSSDAPGADGDYDVGGNSFQFETGYLVPASPAAKLGAAVGIGYYSVSGEVKDSSGSASIEGSTVGFHFAGVAEWTISPGFGANAEVGYRVAKVDETKYGGIKTNAETDYTGLLARVGLAFYLPGK